MIRLKSPYVNILFVASLVMFRPFAFALRQPISLSQALTKHSFLSQASRSTSSSSTTHTHNTNAVSNVSPNQHAWRPFKLFYNDVYEVTLPPKHMFPMAKYRHVRHHLERHIHDTASFDISPLATHSELATTHCPVYVDKVLTGTLGEKEQRRIGFELTVEQIRRAQSSVGGTLAATRLVCAAMRARNGGSLNADPRAMVDGLFAGQLAGGTHHAFYDRGEGYCMFSDIAVAATHALSECGDTVKTVLIVDLDVHQGNGNAKIFQVQKSDTRVTDKDDVLGGGDTVGRVYTFSMHCVGNLFSQKEVSDFDVEVPVGAGDEEYLEALRTHLPRVVGAVKPDLIFYQAGVDPLQYDRLGKLTLTREGLRQRNAYVYNIALYGDIHGPATHTHTNTLTHWRPIPLVITMGGGYPKNLDENSRAFREVVGAHCDVYAGAAEALREYYRLLGGE